MYEGHRVGVVVPAYNEEGFVGEVIDTVPTFVDRIYAIDDCSTDGTWQEICSHAERETEPTATVSIPDGGSVTDGSVVPIQHAENRGVGGAIKTGYRRAREDEMDVVAVLNGDGQMEPEILDRFIEPIVDGEADYVKGNRLSSRDHRDDMSTWRFFGNSVLTVLTKVASGYWKLMDPQNGYTAISAEALSTIDIDGLYDDYGFCNDLLVTLNVHGFRVADVPMRAVYGDETSTIRYRSFIPKLSMLLLSDFVWRLQSTYLRADFHPLIFLYGLGGTGGLLGAVGAIYSVVRGRRRVDGLLNAATVLLLSGFLVVLAMVFDMQQNEHLDRRIGNHQHRDRPEERR